MKVYAISDLHVDYRENWEWVRNLSHMDYSNDILLLAGDISDDTARIKQVFIILEKCFKKVFFVPGNHDLWVIRNHNQDSFARFWTVLALADDHGICTSHMNMGRISIVPLSSWYDYSFGSLTRELQGCWCDFMACKWPDGYEEDGVTRYFLSLNEPILRLKDRYVISMSHFLPRIDLMPIFIPAQKRILYPVLGSSRLENQIRRLGAGIHVYGHSHFNNQAKKIFFILTMRLDIPPNRISPLKRLRPIYDSVENE